MARCLVGKRSWCELAKSGFTFSQRLVLNALVGILSITMGREALHRSNWGAILRALFKFCSYSVNTYYKSASYVARLYSYFCQPQCNNYYLVCPSFVSFGWPCCHHSGCVLEGCTVMAWVMIRIRRECYCSVPFMYYFVLLHLCL